MIERWVAGWVQVQEEEEQEVVMMAWSWSCYVGGGVTVLYMRGEE